jgi:hypothetical protein
MTTLGNIIGIRIVQNDWSDPWSDLPVALFEPGVLLRYLSLYPANQTFEDGEGAQGHSSHFTDLKGLQDFYVHTVCPGSRIQEW